MDADWFVVYVSRTHITTAFSTIQSYIALRHTTLAPFLRA
jgi:hypothetical protein